MSVTRTGRFSAPRGRLLAECIGLAIAAAYGARLNVSEAATQDRSALAERPNSILPVTNCADDESTGSLRKVINSATSGDTIDLTQLSCSRISLFIGEISTCLDNLILKGPTDHELLIGPYSANFRVIEHCGAGTMKLYNLTLFHGSAQNTGGCISSSGNLAIYQSAVQGCDVSESGTGHSVKGGAVYAHGTLTLQDSLVQYSRLEVSVGGNGYGGGAYAGGALIARNSTIRGNDASLSGLYSQVGFGGGLFTRGNADITNSTISGNGADNVAGLSIAGYAAYATIINSTIAYNAATKVMGGIYTNTPLSLLNSTVAFNRSVQKYAYGTFAPGNGLEIYSTNATLISSIIAGNYMTDYGYTFDLNHAGGTISGSNNLVTLSNVAPPDTITDLPALQPLAFHGGTTETITLSGNSPAIDHGANPNGLDSDQRGAGYPRVVGASADIGAVEFTDLVFSNGFD